MNSRIGKVVSAGGEGSLTCEEVIGCLHELLAQDFLAKQEQEVRRHLAICPSCLAYLGTYERAVTLAREVLRWEAEAEPRGLSADQVRAILEART